MRIWPRKNSPVSVTDLLFLIDLTDDSSKLWPKNEEKTSPEISSMSHHGLVRKAGIGSKACNSGYVFSKKTIR